MFLIELISFKVASLGCGQFLSRFILLGPTVFHPSLLFKGEFDKEYSLGIELFDSEEVRDKLDNLGYKINTSNLLDISKIGEYFPTVSDQSEESVIMIFHKLPLDFDYDEGNNFVKKWFGLNIKSIRSLDPFFMQDESSEDQSFEKLQNLKEFTKNWFESESQEWLKFIVKKTKERT